MSKTSGNPCSFDIWRVSLISNVLTDAIFRDKKLGMRISVVSLRIGDFRGNHLREGDSCMLDELKMIVALYIEKCKCFTFFRFCIMGFVRVLEDIHIDVECFSILVLSVGNVSNLELIRTNDNTHFFVQFTNEGFVWGFSWLYVTCGKLPFSIFVACIFAFSEKDFSRTISDDPIYRSKEVRISHSILLKNKNSRILQEF